jgi:hypothetical protein
MRGRDLLLISLFLVGFAHAEPLVPEFNADGQKFVSANGALAVTLDFGKQRIIQMGHYTQLDPEYMARGDFLPIGNDQCLWVLKRVVAIPSHWPRGGAQLAGLGPETPVLMLFVRGQVVYTISYGQLGFRNLVTQADKDGVVVNAWYGSLQLAAPERVVLRDLPSGKAAAGVDIRLLTGAIKPLSPTSRMATR